MATFQVVYDDFSGGQYMGSRPANQPKNTWNGNNVIVSPNGELLPVGTRTAATFAGSAGTTGGIISHYYSSGSAWCFAVHGTTTRMLRYDHSNGTTFPNAVTSTTLSGTVSSRPVYSHLMSGFYYGATASGVGTLRFINTTGSVNTTTSWVNNPSNYTISRVTPYKSRLLLSVTGIPSRLYYTDPDTGTGYGPPDGTQYYEFNSDIVAVYPRTDDLLIICADGIYSLTGTFGSSVNIQMISTASSLSRGMEDGVVLNRNLYFLDSGPSAGSFDGRMYVLAGIAARPVASFEAGDYLFDATGKPSGTPSKLSPIGNSRLAVTFRSGNTYFESTVGTYAKATVWSLSETSTSLLNTSTYQVAEPINNPQDEYFLTAVVDTTNSASPITMYRTISNVAAPTKLDANFTISAGTPTVNPSGTVELSEYWHNKPFTVKEAFIEYSITTGGSVSCTILPTGVVDVPAANLASVASTAASETSPPAGDYRMYRYWPNNAAKGFGVKPQLTITNCMVKRVILNCED